MYKKMGYQIFHEIEKYYSGGDNEKPENSYGKYIFTCN